jgi:hypothetical protein
LQQKLILKYFFLRFFHKNSFDKSLLSPVVRQWQEQWSKTFVLNPLPAVWETILRKEVDGDNFRLAVNEVIRRFFTLLAICRGRRCRCKICLEGIKTLVISRLWI